MEKIMTNKNILIIICDQLSACALKAYGNTYSRTPNIDRIAKDAVQFDHAYVTCPLCQPSRASFWTSLYPHQTNVRTNLPDQGFPAVSDRIPTMGELFQRAGYECVHYGKTHDYGALRGFQVAPQEEVQIERTNPAIKFDYETFLDIDTVKKAADYLRKDHQKSFLMVADFQNPHNICSYIGEHENGIGEFPLDRELPPLPENFNTEDMDNRPDFIRYLCCAHRRQRQVSNWTAQDFQYYLYAYYYYLEIVDRQIGEILDVLEETGKDKNTLLVFFSDHGEGMAAHELVTKYGTFYEETNHVPLFYKGKEIIGNRSIKGVTSLLDILPTLLDYAGLEIPASLEGISQKKQLTGWKNYTENAYIAAEWHDEFTGYTVPGRMICDGNYKYICYRDKEGLLTEELYHIAEDPLEKKNLVKLRRQELVRYRRVLMEHSSMTKDDFNYLKSNYRDCYRKHKAGRENHKGISAVEQYALDRKARKA